VGVGGQDAQVVRDEVLGAFGDPGEVAYTELAWVSLSAAASMSLVRSASARTLLAASRATFSPRSAPRMLSARGASRQGKT
jgi:hypothetical protein